MFAALFEAAEAWLQGARHARATGPFSLSINDESGLLVEGFDTPPSMMMGHAPRYYAAAGRGAGLPQGQGPDRLRLRRRGAAAAARAGACSSVLSKGAGLSFRPLDMRRFDEELQTIVDIFNDAWSDNWGFVPMTRPRCATSPRI